MAIRSAIQLMATSTSPTPVQFAWLLLLSLLSSFGWFTSRGGFRLVSSLFLSSVGRSDANEWSKQVGGRGEASGRSQPAREIIIIF